MKVIMTEQTTRQLITFVLRKIPDTNIVKATDDIDALRRLPYGM